MPIKPENLARYPANWKQISAEARARAGNRCQHPGCTARQYAVGSWEKRGNEWVWQPITGNVFRDAAGQGLAWPSMRPLTYAEARQIALARRVANEHWTRLGDEVGDVKIIVIVLTVAHLDHDPGNCDPANLRVMCQRHHLAYDNDHHRANAQATRRAKAGTLELFA